MKRIAPGVRLLSAIAIAFTQNFLAAAAPSEIRKGCVDWLGSGTTYETIEVFDSADSGFTNPLESRRFQLPTNGVYCVWNLSGHKILRVKKLDASSTSKALISAVFFGSP